MTFTEAVIQGLATGIGVGFANYIHENHISKKLKVIENTLTNNKTKH